MFEIYQEVGWMIWVLLLVIWLIYISTSVQNLRDRLKRLEIVISYIVHSNKDDKI
jgi:hypothetical protein